MEFRWVALIALWTLISGPILGGPTGTASNGKAVKKLVQPAATSTIHVR